jgi:hypothetical protein
MSRPAIIEGLAPKRRALILPVDYQVFYPGLPVYEDLVAPVRSRNRLDVFGLVFPFGVVPEAALVEAPELLAVSRHTPERPGTREMTLRTRAWLDNVGRGYDPIVLLNHGRMMPVWTRAASGCDVANRIGLVGVHHRTGLRGTLVRNRLDKALPP